MSNNQTVCEAQTIDVLRKTCSSAVTVEYAPRTLLFPQGILADSVFFLISGLVKLTHIVSNGRELIVGLRRSGWLLGATAAILNQPQPTGGVTLTHCRVLRVLAGEVSDFIRAESGFSRYLHELQAEEVHRHLLNVVELASHSAEYRLAKLLSDLACEGVGRTVRIPFKQWEIAELLAVTPEHTSRVLRRLEQEGLIVRKGKALFIRAPERLFSLLNS